MWFSLGRFEGFPSQYGSNLTSVTVDILEAGIITAFLILLIACYVSIPTTRISTNISQYIYVTVTLLIGLFLLLTNFGQEWEVGHIESRSPYKAGVAQEISASIGVKIGLRSVNVTLKSKPEGDLATEIIDYNERFSWTWDQGRFGFGPYAGQLQREFRAAQYQGLPLPILWIVDYFVIDGEGFRLGRFYRIAGWYSHIALWSAFAFWLLAVILFRSVLRYGGYCLGVCGILQLTANLLWLVIKNPKPLEIPFEDSILVTRYGSNFWLNFASGLVTVVLAGTIILMDNKFSSKLYTFFGVDPLNAFEEVAYLTKGEIELRRNIGGLPNHDEKNNDFQLRRNQMPDSSKTKKAGDQIPLVNMGGNSNIHDVHNDSDSDDEYMPVYVKKRQTRVMAPPVIRSNKPKHLMANV